MKSICLPLILLLSIVFDLRQAQAQTTYDTSVDRLNALSTLNDLDRVKFRVRTGSSYCCDVTSSFAPDTGYSFPTASGLELNSDSGFQNLVGRYGNESQLLKNPEARVYFLVPPGLTNASVTIPITTDAVNPAQLLCRETTLYGGFNTSITDFNFLELTNTLATTDSEISCRVTATNVVPSPDAVVINQLEVKVKPGSRTDVNIHQAAGTGAFGPISVACDGAPGAIQAALTQYKITSTSPLDFTPVAREVFLTRMAISGGGF